MKNSFFLFSAFSFLLLTHTYAQQKRVTYHKENQREITKASKAYFYRVIESDDKSSGLLKYLEFYTKDNIPRLIGTLSDNSPDSIVGEVKFFYPNGNLAYQATFVQQHQPIDTTFFYHQNGKLYFKLAQSKKKQLKRKNMLMSIEIDEIDVNAISIYDSLGNTLLENGNGYFKLKNPIRDTDYYLEGPVVAGKRQGNWRGKLNQISFEETWENDKLISGTAMNPDGKKDIYDALTHNVFPEYPDGINSLRNFVASAYQYPQKAIDANASGEINIGFIVEKDGTMSNFKVISDLGYGTGRAGIAALKQAKKKWSPGMQRGKAVRVAYTLPLILHLM